MKHRQKIRCSTWLTFRFILSPAMTGLSTSLVALSTKVCALLLLSRRWMLSICPLTQNSKT
ncbi:hypothetical protein CPB83DRAFT_42392 [Crepidotus variabilis]|uniref:Uncharacterized protein n=1 Tax=Crepidotus variabilis TaxID=179855 RepID=A0A9P6JTF1_9AGAR|nr:hypothetical protein CPB83DRAFT_42392 [Crepidotus variabilis]